jgi:hypothetical protein
VRNDRETTFASIESAYEYLALLLDSVDEARGDLDAEVALAVAAGAERRLEAIQLATYKLSQLKVHLTTSRRLLNDLRAIRRLVFGEREAEAAAPPDGRAADPAQLGGADPFSRPAPSAKPMPTTTSWSSAGTAPAVVPRKGTRSMLSTDSTTTPAKTAHHAQTSPRR